tara:strand:+ start:157 stop:489 length:333 start_codon:yes stop_codon:yes gene_type:complete
MTIIWKVVKLESVPSENNLSDVCKKVSWVASEEYSDSFPDYNAFVLGETILNSPDSNSFTTFNDITEDQTMEWVKTKIGSSEVTNVENNITTQVNQMKNGSIKTNLPWNK